MVSGHSVSSSASCIAASLVLLLLICGGVCVIGLPGAGDGTRQPVAQSVSLVPKRASLDDVEVLLVSLLDGRLVAIDSQNGAILWTFDTGSPLVTARQTQGAPAGVTIFPDGSDGSLYAYHLLGENQARLERLPVTVQELVGASPSLTDDGSVVLGKRVTTLYLLDALTGQLRRALSDIPGSLEDHSARALPYDLKTTVLLGREDFSVRSVHLQSGMEVWNATFGRVSRVRPMPAVNTTGAVVTAGDVNLPLPPASKTPRLTVTADNTLLAFDAKTGFKRWSVAFDAPPVGVFSALGAGENQLLTRESARRARPPDVANQSSLAPRPWRSTVIGYRAVAALTEAAAGAVPVTSRVLVGSLLGSLYALPADHLLADETDVQAPPPPAPSLAIGAKPPRKRMRHPDGAGAEEDVNEPAVDLTDVMSDGSSSSSSSSSSSMPPGSSAREKALALVDARHDLVPLDAVQSADDQAVVIGLTCPVGMHVVQSGDAGAPRLPWLPDGISDGANRSDEADGRTGGWEEVDRRGGRDQSLLALMPVITATVFVCLVAFAWWNSAGGGRSNTAALPQLAVLQPSGAESDGRDAGAVSAVTSSLPSLPDSNGSSTMAFADSTTTTTPLEATTYMAGSPDKSNGPSSRQNGKKGRRNSSNGRRTSPHRKGASTTGDGLSSSSDAGSQSAGQEAVQQAAGVTVDDTRSTQERGEGATEATGQEEEQQAGSSQNDAATHFTHHRVVRHGADGSLTIGRLRVGPGILGYGSAGTVVYEGVLDGRSVAVKRLLRQFYDLAKKEIEILIVSDEHPNVVRCFAMEEDREFVYLALERCRSSLADFLGDAVGRSQLVDHATSLALPRCFELMFDVAKGLAALHERDIVHRDLKPHNVLITDTGRAKLSDMGLCKQLVAEQSSFESHGAGGSSGWQAPEQLIARDGGLVRQARSLDIFSMGCVLYYCLTAGRHPFGESYERDTNILRLPPNLIPLHTQPEALNLLCTMLAKDGNERPTMPAVLAHPMWWSAEQRLQFLLDISDRVEGEDREPDQSLLLVLEAVAPAGIGKNWGTQVPADLIANLGRHRRYDYTSLRDLLRVIRNKRSHFREMPASLQASLGPLPDGFLRFFTSRFPHLLMACYCFSLQHLPSEPTLQRYWPAGAASCHPFVAAFLHQHAAKLQPVPPAAAPAPVPVVPTTATTPVKRHASSPARSLHGTPLHGAADVASAADSAGTFVSAAALPPRPTVRLFSHGSKTDLNPITEAAEVPEAVGDETTTSKRVESCSLASACGEGPASHTEGGRTHSRTHSAPDAVEGVVGGHSVSLVVGYEVDDNDTDFWTVKDFPRRPGRTVCEFFSKTGHCKFGETCVFDHPEQFAVKLSRQGLPLRPDATICTFYLKQNYCRFGAACKFHHPSLKAILAGSASQTNGAST